MRAGLSPLFSLRPARQARSLTVPKKALAHARTKRLELRRCPSRVVADGLDVVSTGVEDERRVNNRDDSSGAGPACRCRARGEQSVGRGEDLPERGESSGRRSMPSSSGGATCATLTDAPELSLLGAALFVATTHLPFILMALTLSSLHKE